MSNGLHFLLNTMNWHRRKGDPEADISWLSSLAGKEFFELAGWVQQLLEL